MVHTRTRSGVAAGEAGAEGSSKLQGIARKEQSRSSSRSKAAAGVTTGLRSILKVAFH